MTSALKPRSNVKNHIREPLCDRVFSAIVYVLLAFILTLVLYPLYFVVVASFSDPTYVNSGTLLLYPKGFTMLGYERVFSDDRIWTGYGNTIIYTVFGTILGLFATIMAGYSLSRKDLPGRNIVMGLMVFTMYFGGGLIPFYMVVKGLEWSIPGSLWLSWAVFPYTISSLSAPSSPARCPRNFRRPLLSTAAVIAVTFSPLWFRCLRRLSPLLPVFGCGLLERLLQRHDFYYR